MPALSVQQAKAIVRGAMMNKPPSQIWNYAFNPLPRRRRGGKPKTPSPKICSYCGGKVGQGFKQITIPRIIQVRICAACLLKAYNWVFAQIEKEKNDTTTSPQS